MSKKIGMMKIAGRVSVLFILALSSGCATTARLTADPMPRLSNPTPKNLTVLAEATDARRNRSDQVGRHTFTVFMIPTFGVFAEDPVEKMVGGLFVEALKQSGYQVNTVEKLGEASGPVLSVQTDSIRNYLFSWLYPLGLTGGRAQLTPVLFGNDGKILWKGRSCAAWGGCPSLIYMCGFDTSLNLEMSSIMRQIMNQINSKEFIEAATPKQ